MTSPKCSIHCQNSPKSQRPLGFGISCLSYFEVFLVTIKKLLKNIVSTLTDSPLLPLTEQTRFDEGPYCESDLSCRMFEAGKDPTKFGDHGRLLVRLRYYQNPRDTGKQLALSTLGND